MQRAVRGFWGPRVESMEALAGRWKLTLDRLAELLPAAVAVTWQQVHASGPATDLPADEASLDAALRGEQAAEGWSDRTGVSLRLVSAAGRGWEVEVSGRAGGVSEFLLQSMVIAVKSPDDAEVPDVELLAAVAEFWAPDFGDVSDDDVLDALEDDAGFTVDDPSVGWVGYLSPRRAALAPADFPGSRKDVQGGGTLLGVASPGDTAAVLHANLLLRDAGALQPLPRPMDRPHL